MKRLALTLLLVATVSLGQATPSDKWIGGWSLNVAKSKSEGGPLPQRSTLTFESTAAGLKVSNDWVNSLGTPAHTEFTARYDGKEVPVDGLPAGNSVSLTRTDASTFDMIQKSNTGLTIAGHHVVSRDGKTLTVTQTVTNADGLKLTNRHTFDRLN